MERQGIKRRKTTTTAQPKTISDKKTTWIKYVHINGTQTHINRLHTEYTLQVPLLAVVVFPFLSLTCVHAILCRMSLLNIKSNWDFFLLSFSLFLFFCCRNLNFNERHLTLWSHYSHHVIQLLQIMCAFCCFAVALCECVYIICRTVSFSVLLIQRCCYFSSIQPLFTRCSRFHSLLP